MKSPIVLLHSLRDTLLEAWDLVVVTLPFLVMITLVGVVVYLVGQGLLALGIPPQIAVPVAWIILVYLIAVGVVLLIHRTPPS